jgi:tRNA nucleotidyltransferase/poly(A) polymerase
MTLRDELLRRFPALAKLPPRSYVVGGAIRDLLLGREPLDVDVATDDALAAARALRRNVITLGRELAAHRVIVGDRIYDFADTLGRDIARDLQRRDFTMNAMALDLATGELLDPNGGAEDARNGIVRMVDAINFDEDPLRILKGVRMAVKYGFTLDAATRDAIHARAATIVSVAAERVTAELAMIFSANAFTRAVALLHDTALDAPIFGRTLDAAAFHADDVALAGAYALLVDSPRAFAERWKWSDQLLRETLTLQRLIEHHDAIALYDAGRPIASQLPPVLRALGRDATLPDVPYEMKTLLNGDELGVAPGPELGRIKRALLEAQIRGEVRTREEAEAFVRAARRPPSS